ncbi:MAG: hypothetical protein HY562_03020 [Ignavibacteriales bacterium]|nr:hypothetical protein [Ignavibacteriales bacterium]
MSKIQSIFLPVFTLCALLSQFGCDSGVEPPQPPKDPREFAWTVDTFYSANRFQWMMYDIWGSSPTNVYVVGRTSDDGGQLYRYDGKVWTNIVFPRTPRPSAKYEFRGIYGIDFASGQTIWTVGDVLFFVSPTQPALDSSYILCFDGSQWKEQLAGQGRSLQAVWGISSSDVWAGGTHGTMFRYDGVQWKRIPLPKSVWVSSISGFASNDVYATAYELDTLESFNPYYLLHWNGSLWSIVDSSRLSITDEKFGYNQVLASSGNIYTVGEGIFQRVGSSWNLLFRDDEADFATLQVKDANNIMVGGNFNHAYHYNGSNWYRFPFQSPTIHFSSLWWGDHEAFFVAIESGGNKSFVFRGK